SPSPTGSSNKAGSAACRGCRGSILAVVPWISIGAGGNPALYLSYIALYANSICFVKSLLSNKGARQRWSPSLLLMQAKAGGLLASSIASLLISLCGRNDKFTQPDRI